MSKRRVETGDYVGMCGRVLRALGRRVADGDPVDLASAVALRAELDAIITDSVRQMRSAHGFSWQQIGDELGVTRQAAYQRFGQER